MPHTRSAKKRLRQSEKRREHNRSVKRALKKQIKKLLDLVKTGPKEKVTEEFNRTAQKLDRAASKRVIHPNLAARRKSRLSRVIKAQTQPAASTS